jgi:hypothetical protein
MKNHAFLIPVHTQPQLLGRILRVLEQSNHYFFVHVDKKSNLFDEFKRACAGIENVCFTNQRIAVYHAGISQVHVSQILIKEAMAHEVDFDYYHVISGQDYPLRSNQQFDDFFEQTTHSFMYIDEGDFKASMDNHYERSINRCHFNKTTSYVARIYNKFRLYQFVQLICPRPKLQHLIGGWDWFSWSRATTHYVMDYLRQHPEYLRRFDHTSCSIEIIYATLLEPQKERLEIETTNPLRYISWHPHRPVQTTYRPFNLTEEDYPFVIDSKAFFCRKVDEVESARLLDMIDAQRGDDYDINEHEHYV